MPRRLFAYGTLRDPDVLALVLGRAVAPAALAAATAPGHRVVVFPGRTYPAIVAAPGTAAEGTLVSNLSAGDMKLLDLFEGEEYSRRRIELIVTGRAASADVYWPARDIPADAADWRLADWAARHKAAFLAVEARSISELRHHLSQLPR